MIRFFLCLALCLTMFLSCCFAEEKTSDTSKKPASTVITLQNFTSAVVVVNRGDGAPMGKEAELFADELKQLGITPIPEEIAWELYKLSKKNTDVERYRYYLSDAYDTVVQADVFPVNSLFRIRFTLVSLKDSGMPVLFSREMEVTGNQDEALIAAFYSFVQELVGMRSNVLTV